MSNVSFSKQQQLVYYHSSGIITLSRLRQGRNAICPLSARKMLSRRFKFITFDANGTLLKLRTSVGQIYSEVALKHGIKNADPVELEWNFRRVYKEMDKMYANFGYNSPLKSWTHWWTTLVMRTFEESLSNCQFIAQQRQVSRVTNELCKLFGTKEGWTSVPNAEDILRELHSAQVHSGVISNTDPRLHGVLRELGLSQYLSFALTSYEVGAMKPDPLIFHEAARLFRETTGEFDASRCLHVGNDVTRDYHGARQVGCESVLIGNKAEVLKSDAKLNPKHIFENLDELRKFGEWE